MINAIFSLTLSLLALSSVQATPPPCTATHQRKEFRELIVDGKLNEEGQAFIDGVNCMAGKPSVTNPKVTQWDDLASSHYDAIMSAHGTSKFFPWHRLFLVSAEKAMSACLGGGKQVSIPYWDSSLDSQSPETSMLWYVTFEHISLISWSGLSLEEMAIQALLKATGLLRKTGSTMASASVTAHLQRSD